MVAGSSGRRFQITYKRLLEHHCRHPSYPASPNRSDRRRECLGSVPGCAGSIGSRRGRAESGSARTAPGLGGRAWRTCSANVWGTARFRLAAPVRSKILEPVASRGRRVRFEKRISMASTWQSSRKGALKEPRSASSRCTRAAAIRRAGWGRSPRGWIYAASAWRPAAAPINRSASCWPWDTTRGGCLPSRSSPSSSATSFGVHVALLCDL